jgi:DNA-binding response OmpR family regulator
MTLKELGTRWAALQGSLREKARVLVVDDDEHVRDLLATVVDLAGYGVDSVESAEEAIERLRGGSYDLLIVDKNLPGADGVDLIGQVRAEAIDTPAMLVTGYASTETVSRALGHGAIDYISKPFDDVTHLQKRVETVVEQHRERVVVQQIAQDLKSLAQGEGASESQAREIGQRLAQARRDLDKRPDVLMIDENPLIADSGARFLERAGLSVARPGEGALSLDELSSRGAMCVFLNLDMADSLHTVNHLRQADPDIGILVSGRTSGLREAIAAIAGGADDFVLGSDEGLDVLVARTKRLVNRSRSARLSHVLVGLLQEMLGGMGDDVARAFSFLSTPLEALPAKEAAEDLEPDFDIDTEETVELPAPAGPMALDRHGAAGAPLAQQGTPARDQIEFGLEQLGDAQALVPSVATLRAYRTLAELGRFFSDERRRSDPAAVKRFLEGDSGALAAVLASQEELRASLPEPVRVALEAGRFTHPWQPDYLQTSKG